MTTAFQNPDLLFERFYSLLDVLERFSHPRVDKELLQKTVELVQKAKATYEEACIEYLNDENP
jgi:hypothetical protein